jgi:hypothetical protein
MSTRKQQQQENRAKLLQILDEHFDEGELRDLCFVLGIPYSRLPGDSIHDKARELVLHCERHGLVHELEQVLRQMRPRAAWHSVSSNEQHPQTLEIEHGNSGAGSNKPKLCTAQQTVTCTVFYDIVAVSCTDCTLRKVRDADEEKP